MIVETWRRRTLILSFVRRQYQLRYRQSFAGIAWAVVPPIVGLVGATIVFDEVIGVDTGGVPYPLFALAGLAPWSFFASSLSAGIPSVASQQTMVTRLAFPRSAIPISVVGTGLIDLGITSALFVAYAVVTGAGLPLTSFLAVPLLLVEVAFVLGIVLLGSALNVFARDLRLAVPLIVQVWLLITPVMYPLDTVPERLRTFYLANPMTGLVESFRAVLIAGQAPEATILVPALVGTVVTLLIGTWYFTATEPRFADVI